MFHILDFSDVLGNETLITAMLAVAFIRIFIEVIGINMLEWPIAKAMGEVRARQIHRSGLIFSIGFILLFAPQVLLGH